MNNKDIMERVLNRLDKIDDKLASVDKTLIKQESNLELHMTRTAQNERMIEIILSDIKPIKKHIGHMEGAFKFIGLLSLVLAVIGGILKLLGAF